MEGIPYKKINSNPFFRLWVQSHNENASRFYVFFFSIAKLTPIMTSKQVAVPAVPASQLYKKLKKVGKGAYGSVYKG
jgi:hypothetical protein